jgi:hypothetical protein
MVALPKRSPRSAFPPSKALTERLFVCDGGLFLVVGRDVGDGVTDPVTTLGWSESEYWARRVVENTYFLGDLNTIPEPTWSPLSLVGLGRPEVLSYKNVCDFESTNRADGLGSVQFGADYRFFKDGAIDGAFMYHYVDGRAEVRITYYFAQPNPRPADLPVGFQIPLGSRAEDVYSRN